MMKIKYSRHFVLLVAIFLLFSSITFSYTWFKENITRKYEISPRLHSCLVCHTSQGKEKLNAFGLDFVVNGGGDEAILALRESDSDGDGFSNDLELLSGHYPGDSRDFPTKRGIQALKTETPLPVDLEKEMLETLQCPCCDKVISNCKCQMIPKIKEDIKKLIQQGDLDSDAMKKHLASKYGQRILPLTDRNETLSPEQFENLRIRNAYQIAKDQPQLLEKYPCFCSCYRSKNHESLLDCYKNEHSTKCDICIAEAEVIKELHRNGLSEKEIRKEIVERFSKGS
jgi:cytochrome c-type biogenesis protein CcmH/NrfF